MNVLVTGGAGFIGSNLCSHLRGSGAVDRLVVLDDLSSGFEANLAEVDEVTLDTGTILDAALVDALVADADAVVHLAARPSVPRSIADPRATHQVNVDGTFNVLDAARRAGGRHVIMASSSSVYGSNPTLPKHEGLLPIPVSPYAASKLAGESYGRAYSSVFGVPVLTFRFFNVFGPRQAANHAYAAVLPQFISAALARHPLPVHGDGQQTRDFTYVGSVTSVLGHALTNRVVHDGPVNLAFGNRVSLLEVIAILEDVMGAKMPVEHGAPRVGDVRDSQADSTLLRSLFPSIEPLPLRLGIESTVAWFREQLDTASNASSG